MKKLRHFIIYLSIFTIVTISIITAFPFKVYAEVPTSMTAIPHSSSWGGYDFNYHFHKKYWTIQDPTGIPTSQLTAPNYFYKDRENTFIMVNGRDLIQLVLTQGLSIVLNPEIAPAVIQAFFTSIGPPRVDGTSGLFVQGGVYDGQNNFLGYALNDISNCYYEGAEIPAGAIVKIPSETTNNVYEFYKYYNKHQYPDYINVQPPSYEWALPKLNTTTYADVTNDPLWREYVETNKSTLFDCDNYRAFEYCLDSAVNENRNWTYYYISWNYKINDAHYIYSDSGDTKWNNLCEYFELFDGNNELLASEIYLNPKIPNSIGINARMYNNSDGSPLTSVTTNNFNYRVVDGVREYYHTEGTATAQNGLTMGLCYNGSVQSHPAYEVLLGKPYTIYKSQAVYDSINTTKDYKPDSLIGSNYYNYNTNTDNSINTTIENIDNSTTNNETIYNEGDEIIVDNTSDGQIDQTQVNVDIDIVIENVYPDNGSGGGSGDTPTNPEYPEENDGILDAILAALLRFFQAIGKILGTVLAGLLEVIDAVLETIADIADNFTGVTAFISAIFSWLPAPVPQVIAVGLSITILAAIIRFIRG